MSKGADRRDQLKPLLTLLTAAIPISIVFSDGLTVATIVTIVLNACIRQQLVLDLLLFSLLSKSFQKRPVADRCLGMNKILSTFFRGSENAIKRRLLSFSLLMIL